VTLRIDLTGRRALITGAGQGVGHGLALAFATAGAEVLVNDLRAERADAVVDEVLALGAKASAAVCDVTDFDAVVKVVDTWGGVDILVNNAGNAGAEGFTGRGPFAESQPSDWEPYLRVNLYGAMYCTRAVLPAMIDAKWGRIVTIVSDAGRTGDANGAAYAASKAGAAGLTRSIALGTMRTPMTEPLWAEHADSPQAKAILQNYAIRRPGNPDDAAALVALLASDHGSWITGQTIPVNGGFSFAQ